MSPSARVSSIEALSIFRAALLVYRTKAGGVLDDARQDVVKTRVWLETDRQLHWSRELRRRAAELAQAEQELLTARLSGLPGALQERRLAVDRARKNLRETGEALERVRRWHRRYPTDVEAKLQSVHSLQQTLSQDLQRAAAFLETTANTLAEYATLSPGPSTVAVATPTPSDGVESPSSGVGPQPGKPGATP